MLSKELKKECTGGFNKHGTWKISDDFKILFDLWK